MSSCHLVLVCFILVASKYLSWFHFKLYIRLSELGLNRAWAEPRLRLHLGLARSWLSDCGSFRKKARPCTAAAAAYSSTRQTLSCRLDFTSGPFLLLIQLHRTLKLIKNLTTKLNIWYQSESEGDLQISRPVLETPPSQWNGSSYYQSCERICFD